MRYKFILIKIAVFTISKSMEEYYLNNLTKRKTNKKEKETYLGSISLAMSSFLEYFLSLFFNFDGCSMFI